ncbi:MAG: septal ring lytic transglycosylase RlpA family protein, partial [Acidimicrobiia bacterium]|nr:septal ring lytic transglycosylase RlpA family protein [Acidimicrobiia bacterium]
DEYQWPNGSACQASWYGPGLEGSPTASGEPFDPEQLTGAIHDVPFGTLVRVSRADTGASIMVRINDRGPFIWDDGWRRHPARCIDLSPAAMRAIDDTGDGVIDVTINY